MINQSKSKQADLSFDTLKGMQSVRATFTLPKQTISLLSTVANQLGVKQKSIFDHLVEDKNALDQIADQAQKYEPTQDQRKQKTFVLSRNCLNALDKFSKAYQLPRDILVEFSLKQLDPVLEKEKLRHENRKTLLNKMQIFQKFSCQLMNNAKKLMGDDDEIVQKLQSFLEQYDKIISDLETAIEKGKSIEEFQ